MVAMSRAGDFGYAEQKLAEDRCRVTYTTPRMRTSTSSEERSRDVEALKQQAHDLALWRAAQLAQQAGYPALHVDSDRRDADLTLRREGDPFYRPFPYPYPYLYGPGAWPHCYDGPYCGGYRYRSDAWARVTGMLVVTFLREPTDDSLDAAATINELSARYASATYPAGSG